MKPYAHEKKVEFANPFVWRFFLNLWELENDMQWYIITFIPSDFQITRDLTLAIASILWKCKRHALTLIYCQITFNLKFIFPCDEENHHFSMFLRIQSNVSVITLEMINLFSSRSMIFVLSSCTKPIKWQFNHANASFDSEHYRRKIIENPRTLEESCLR